MQINTADNICVLPTYHEKEYYYDEKNKQPNLKNIFDEDFANYYALKVNNCQKEIETIRTLFGDEFTQVLDAELTNVSEKLALAKENETQQDVNNIMERIKSIAVFTKQSEIQDINALDKTIEKEDKNMEEEGK